MSRSDFLAQRSLQKRSAILDAARRRFAADGYTGASMEAIALAAEVSTATLYKLFPSKLALFGDVWRAELDHFAPIQTAAATVAPAERPLAVARIYARGLNDPVRLGLLRAMLAGVSATPEIGAQFYENVRVNISSAFSAMALSLHESGHIVCSDEAQANLAGGQLMGMVEHWMLWGLLFADARPKAPPDEIAAAAADAFWRAWGARRPVSDVTPDRGG
ncbi:MAG: TetR/AcrR family transcriptional regulator [Hyphomonadaceae bacterium]|nr:TetR/AcrR family transcriptional regulator [Hyphomonadaceae bacterium]